MPVGAHLTGVVDAGGPVVHDISPAEDAHAASILRRLELFETAEAHAHAIRKVDATLVVMTPVDSVAALLEHPPVGDAAWREPFELHPLYAARDESVQNTGQAHKVLHVNRIARKEKQAASKPAL